MSNFALQKYFKKHGFLVAWGTLVLPKLFAISKGPSNLRKAYFILDPLFFRII